MIRSNNKLVALIGLLTVIGSNVYANNISQTNAADTLTNNKYLISEQTLRNATNEAVILKTQPISYTCINSNQNEVSMVYPSMALSVQSNTVDKLSVFLTSELPPCSAPVITEIYTLPIN